MTENIAPPKFKNTSLTGLPAEGTNTLTKPNRFTLDTAHVFDPTTMNASAFELRGDGLDGQFNTGDDSFIPFTLRFGAANNVHYMIANNRLFFSDPRRDVAGHVSLLACRRWTIRSASRSTATPTAPPATRSRARSPCWPRRINTP